MQYDIGNSYLLGYGSYEFFAAPHLDWCAAPLPWISSTCFPFPGFCNLCVGCPKLLGGTHTELSDAWFLQVSGLCALPCLPFTPNRRSVLATIPVLLVKLRLQPRGSVAVVYLDKESSLKPAACKLLWPWRFCSRRWLHTREHLCRAAERDLHKISLMCKRTLTVSEITVMPSVTCVDWLHWWYNHMAHLVSSSTTLAFLTHTSEKHKSASPSAIQVKNQWNTIGIQEKLHVMSQLKRSEWTVCICRNVRLTHPQNSNWPCTTRCTCPQNPQGSTYHQARGTVRVKN
jgi:hypothetical protein